MLTLVFATLSFVFSATPGDLPPSPSLAPAELSAPAIPVHELKNSEGFDVTIGPVDQEGHQSVTIVDPVDGYYDEGYLDGHQYISTYWGSTWDWVWFPMSTPEGTVWVMAMFWDNHLVDWWTPLP